MNRIIIRKKISPKSAFYVLMTLIIIPILYFQYSYQNKYNEYTEKLNGLLNEKDITGFAAAIEEHFQKLGSTKKTLLLYLEYLEQKAHLENDPANWQQVIKTVCFLENHYYFVPQSTILLKAKAFFHLGTNSYNQSIVTLDTIDFLKKKSQFNLSEIQMAYTMYKSISRYREAEELINYLITNDPENILFQIELASFYIKKSKNTKARQLLKEIVFSTSYNLQIKKAAISLIDLTKELAIYGEVDYLYTYIIEKSNFDQNFIKSYLQFLKKQNQIKKAHQYIVHNYRQGRIDKANVNLFKKIML